MINYNFNRPPLREMSSLENIRRLLDNLEQEQKLRPEVADAICQTDPVDPYFITDWVRENKENVNFLLTMNEHGTNLLFRPKDTFTVIDYESPRGSPRETRGPGRPKGSKNKATFGPTPTNDFVEVSTEDCPPASDDCPAEIYNSADPRSDDERSEDYRVAFSRVHPIKTPDYNEFMENCSIPPDSDVPIESDLETGEEREPSPKRAKKEPKNPIAKCPKCDFQCEIHQQDLYFGVTMSATGQKKRQSWCKKCRVKSWNDNRGEDEKEISPPGTPDSTIMSRKDNVYLIENPSGEGHKHPPSLKIKLKVKGSSETWEEAEKRHKEKSHPIIKKRMKCLKLLAKQEGTSIADQMKKNSGVTTTELFIRVKKNSPMIISSCAQSDDDEGDNIS